MQYCGSQIIRSVLKHLFNNYLITKKFFGLMGALNGGLDPLGLPPGSAMAQSLGESLYRSFKSQILSRKP